MTNDEATCASCGSRTAQSARTSRRGFTLVELLVVIMIIGILSALLLGVAANAGGTGRSARTKSMITRLHALVMEQYDSYRSRRAVVRTDNPTLNASLASLQGSRRGQKVAEYRLYALRELMLMEMPDRWSDILLAPINNNPKSTVCGTPSFLTPSAGSQYGGPTPLVEAYRREFYRLAENGASAEDIADNQGAECLYMFVMFATADGEARGLFAENQAADTDGDGALEFIDGNGQAIEWLRWPAGFVSSLQSDVNSLIAKEDAWVADGRPVAVKGQNPRITASSNDHDPFDIYRASPARVNASTGKVVPESDNFRLVPLIFSAGADKLYGIFTARDTMVWNSGGINPYRLFDASPSNTTTKAYMGTPVLATATGNPLKVDTADAIDNISNHLIQSE